MKTFPSWWFTCGVVCGSGEGAGMRPRLSVGLGTASTWALAPNPPSGRQRPSASWRAPCRRGDRWKPGDKGRALAFQGPQEQRSRCLGDAGRGAGAAAQARGCSRRGAGTGSQGTPGGSANTAGCVPRPARGSEHSPMWPSIVGRRGHACPASLRHVPSLVHRAGLPGPAAAHGAGTGSVHTRPGPASRRG